MISKDFLSKSIRYCWIAIVIGVITALFVTPFLAPLFFKFGNIFNEHFLGYDSPYNSDWYGLTAAITASFFALVVVNEFKSESLGNSYSNDIDFNKVKIILIKFIKFAVTYVVLIFLFSIATYILFLVTNLLSKW